MAWAGPTNSHVEIMFSYSTCIASTRYSDKMEMRIVRTANQKRALHLSIWLSSEVSALWTVFASTSCKADAESQEYFHLLRECFLQETGR